MEKKTYKIISTLSTEKMGCPNIQWLYIDINAKELMTEVEPKVNN